jgi:hypothetical protein
LENKFIQYIFWSESSPRAQEAEPQDAPKTPASPPFFHSTFSLESKIPNFVLAFIPRYAMLYST